MRAQKCTRCGSYDVALVGSLYRCSSCQETFSGLVDNAHIAGLEKAKDERRRAFQSDMYDIGNKLRCPNEKCAAFDPNQGLRNISRLGETSTFRFECTYCGEIVSLSRCYGPVDNVAVPIFGADNCYSLNISPDGHGGIVVSYRGLIDGGPDQYDGVPLPTHCKSLDVITFANVERFERLSAIQACIGAIRMVAEIPPWTDPSAAFDASMYRSAVVDSLDELLPSIFHYEQNYVVSCDAKS